MEATRRCDRLPFTDPAQAAAAAPSFSAPRPVSSRSPARAASTLEGAREKIVAIEAREGGRLGVAILDTSAGARLGYRDDERFPMCSTFKLLAAAAVLKRVDDGAERLDREIAYTAADLLDYAPVAKAHATEGRMSVADLCAAAIDWSDNTAGNLILQSIGGPAGFT